MWQDPNNRSFETQRENQVRIVFPTTQQQQKNIENDEKFSELNHLLWVTVYYSLYVDLLLPYYPLR